MARYHGRHRDEDTEARNGYALAMRVAIWGQRVDKMTNRTPGAPLPDPPAHRTDPRRE